MIKFLVALLLYLPTTAFIGSHVYILFIPIAFVFNKKEILIEWRQFIATPFVKKYLKSVWLIIVLLIGIVINSLFGTISLRNIMEGPLFLFPLTLLSAYVIADRKVLRILLAIISIEIGIGFVQYFLGVNSFFSWLPKFYEFINYDSFYHTRVFGLSENSSYLAQKSILGIILLYFVKLKIRTSWLVIIYSMFIGGVIVTFGRTTIVVLAFSILVYIISFVVNSFMKRTIFYGNMDKGLLGITICFLIYIGSTLSFWVSQFTRFDLIPRFLADSEGANVLRMFGFGNIDMAGRRDLWAKSIEFITEHPFLGNHSTRFLVNQKHVHNSLLEFMSTHGLILFALMLAFIIFHFTRLNTLFVGAILLFSVGQFGIFWDISFLDIVFFSVLLFATKITNPAT